MHKHIHEISKEDRYKNHIYFYPTDDIVKPTRATTPSSDTPATTGISSINLSSSVSLSDSHRQQSVQGNEIKYYNYNFAYTYCNTNKVVLTQNACTCTVLYNSNHSI